MCVKSWSRSHCKKTSRWVSVVGKRVYDKMFNVCIYTYTDTAHILHFHVGLTQACPKYHQHASRLTCTVKVHDNCWPTTSICNVLRAWNWAYKCWAWQGNGEVQFVTCSALVWLCAHGKRKSNTTAVNDYYSSVSYPCGKYLPNFQ